MSTLAEILSMLKGKLSVIVSGPQRSGTTIATRILSEELDLEYVDEKQCGINDFSLTMKLIEEGGVVIQLPALCNRVHEFDCSVVMMSRSILDIITSERRIGWQGCESGELKKYKDKSGPISEVKYQAWDDWQRDLCVDPFDLDYESMATHRLWIPKSSRCDFGIRQWQL